MPPTARFLLSHVVREINRKTDGQNARELTKTNIQGGYIMHNEFVDLTSDINGFRGLTPSISRRYCSELS